MYVIRFTEDGLADIKALPKNVRNFLKKEIQGRLARDAYGSSTELNEPLEGWRSFRCGKYRIVFKVYEDLKLIAIAGVGERLPQSRSDTYRKLEALVRKGKLAEKVLAALRGFSPPPEND